MSTQTNLNEKKEVEIPSKKKKEKFHSKTQCEKTKPSIDND
jgi:hypothetical protein